MKNLKLESGQTLITLLFFMIIALTITSATVTILLINIKSTTKLEQGTLTYYIAESGIENAILRLLRDPNYTGETLPVGLGTATVTVTGADPKTIRSTGTLDNFSRIVEAQVGYTNNILTITSWKEVL